MLYYAIKKKSTYIRQCAYRVISMNLHRMLFKMHVYNKCNNRDIRIFFKNNMMQETCGASRMMNATK